MASALVFQYWILWLTLKKWTGTGGSCLLSYIFGRLRSGGSQFKANPGYVLCSKRKGTKVMGYDEEPPYLGRSREHLSEEVTSGRDIKLVREQEMS
jgi:hypothetical protein